MNASGPGSSVREYDQSRELQLMVSMQSTMAVLRNSFKSEGPMFM